MKTLCIQGRSFSDRFAGRIAMLFAGAGLVFSVAQSSETLDMPVYKPPCRGAPVTRVGGGTRGMGDKMSSIHVLAPGHTGQTSQAQPVLLWHITQSLPVRYDFMLTSEEDDEPLVEARLEEVSRAGIHRISLSDYGINLKSGISYQWLVSQMPSAEHGTAVAYASGKIERVEPNEAEREYFEKASGERLVAAYASAGFWYDAVHVLSELIKADPDNAHLQQMLISLLQQIGLDDVARDLGG